MPESWNPKEKDMHVKHIESENQFWLFVQDARVQFAALGLVIDSLEEDELLSFARQKKFLTLEERLSNEGKEFSSEVMQNQGAQLVIKNYNELIDRLKTFKTKDELRQIIEESNEILEKFNLGLKK